MSWGGASSALRSISAERHPLKSQSLQPGERCLYLGQPRTGELKEAATGGNQAEGI